MTVLQFLELDTIRRIADQLFPHGALRATLQRQYHRRFNSLYALNAIVSAAQVIDEERALVQLVNGIQLLGPADEAARPALRYGDPSKLDRIGHLQRWGTFLQTLGEIYVQDIYQVSTLRPGSTVLDLGAHCGSYTIRAALAVGPSGQVIAVEPSKHNFKLLQENVRLNDLHNVTTLHAGVWSTKTRRKLQLSSVSVAHTLQESVIGAAPSTRFEEVDVDTVDNILQNLRLDHVDFLKMDIEGAEVEAIQGMKNILQSDNIRLTIAAYHNLNGSQTYRSVSQELQHYGFGVRICRGLVYATRGTDR